MLHECIVAWSLAHTWESCCRAVVGSGRRTVTDPCYDALAYLWERDAEACLACRYGYAGHRESVERGRLFWSGVE